MKPKISKILPEMVPPWYRLGVDGWSFSEEKLRETLPDGTRKLLTLDISISPEEFVKKVNNGNVSDIASRVNEHYSMICPLNCPGCFEKGDVKNYLLNFQEVKSYLEQALELGLESVKFLGPGELIANPDLFEILNYLNEKRLKTLIFTKGGILGDERQSIKYHRLDSETLVRTLCSYENIRVMMDCRTFDLAKANQMAHSTYAEARNMAIELLAKNEMNSDLFCQRMSLQTNPASDDNIDEILEIFKWGTERNMPVCVTPTMVSGRGKLYVDKAKTPQFRKKLTDLYTNIYIYLIKRGIMTFNQLEYEGVSSYAGIVPCNQLSCGLYIRKDGVVQRCPGNDNVEFIVTDDVRKTSLKEIWKNSENYALGPRFNNRCVKDGHSIPITLYDDVLNAIKRNL